MKLKVFVSSVQKEFEYERREIANLVAQDPLLSKYFKVLLFDEIPAADSPAQDSIVRAVDDSDVFIMLIGREYGYAGKEGFSFTEQEYRLAREKGKPLLVFIKGSSRLSRDAKIQSFIREIQSEIIYRRFTDSAGLRREVSSSLVQLLETFEVAKSTRQKQDRDLLKPSEGSSANVFLVHGRDEKVLYSVARFLDKLMHKVTILSEQPSKGKTVIEKFEYYSNVGFAVILLTGDDRGGLSDVPAKKLIPRARQNVIFELGYFIGKIGRDKVCALYTPGVELPSDYSGVVYIFFDENGGWKNRLAREIRAEGINIDTNALLE